MQQIQKEITFPFLTPPALAQARDPERLLRGIQSYVQLFREYNTPHNPDKYAGLSHEVVWTNDISALQYYAPEESVKLKGPILLVPSLINTARIFDLTQNCSMISHLTQQGHPLYLLNWGALADYNATLTLQDAQKSILQEGLEAASSHAQSSLHLFGYCLGGALLLNAGHNIQKYAASIILAAVPVNFHAKETPWSHLLGKLSSMSTLIERRGNLSKQMLQSFFAQVSPENVISKYMRLVDEDLSEAEVDLFIAVEIWLNSGSDLPCSLAIDILEQFFERDCLMDKAKLGLPCLLIAPQNDRLVPDAASRPADRLFDRTDTLKPECGHIGMMAGRRAKTDVWQPVSDWVSDRA